MNSQISENQSKSPVDSTQIQPQEVQQGSINNHKQEPQSPLQQIQVFSTNNKVCPPAPKKRAQKRYCKQKRAKKQYEDIVPTILNFDDAESLNYPLLTESNLRQATTQVSVQNKRQKQDDQQSQLSFEQSPFQTQQSLSQQGPKSSQDQQIQKQQNNYYPYMSSVAKRTMFAAKNQSLREESKNLQKLQTIKNFINTPSSLQRSEKVQTIIQHKQNNIIEGDIQSSDMQQKKVVTEQARQIPQSKLLTSLNNKTQQQDNSRILPSHQQIQQQQSKQKHEAQATQSPQLQIYKVLDTTKNQQQQQQIQQEPSKLEKYHIEALNTNSDSQAISNNQNTLLSQKQAYDQIGTNLQKQKPSLLTQKQEASQLTNDNKNFINVFQVQSQQKQNSDQSQQADLLQYCDLEEQNISFVKDKANTNSEKDINIISEDASPQYTKFFTPSEQAQHKNFANQERKNKNIEQEIQNQDENRQLQSDNTPQQQLCNLNQNYPIRNLFASPQSSKASANTNFATPAYLQQQLEIIQRSNQKNSLNSSYNTTTNSDIDKQKLLQQSVSKPQQVAKMNFADQQYLDIPSNRRTKYYSVINDHKKDCNNISYFTSPDKSERSNFDLQAFLEVQQSRGKSQDKNVQSILNTKRKHKFEDNYEADTYSQFQKSKKTARKLDL